MPEMNVSLLGQMFDLISTGDRILRTVFLATCIRPSPCIKGSLKAIPQGGPLNITFD